MKRTTCMAVFAAGGVLALAACGSSSPTGSSTASGGGGTSAASGQVVVGSANFPENQLLAAIYAAALRDKGVKVSEKPNIGAREVYLGAMKDGSINVIPEYTGALAIYYNPKLNISKEGTVEAALKSLLPKNLQVLNASKAEDKDSITVTGATASKYHLKTLADLKPVAGKLVLGAQSEFQKRPQGVPGLKKQYGVVFKQFRALGGSALVNALKNGQVDAADIFTSDPAITTDKFVVLKDTKGLFGAQFVVPLIAKDHATPTVVKTLNAVSTKLTTTQLSAMRNKVEGSAHQDPDTVAKAWVKSAGL